MSHDRWSNAVLSLRPLWGFRDLLLRFAQYHDWPTLGALEEQWLLAANVRTMAGEPLRLIEPTPRLRRPKPRSRNDLYDSSVANGRVPTRYRNWHDFFNVMMFVAFPSGKALLHSRHRRILEARVPEQVSRLPGTRTTEQDCLTMLDEGGVLLCVHPENVATLDRQLDAGAHDELPGWVRDGRLAPWLFGHAHAEHLVRRALNDCSRELPRAKPVVLGVAPNAPRSQVDFALTKRLAEPDFCVSRDGRRALSLEPLYLELHE
ncbi:MAG TPA: DUF3025 domain-containing protein [Polyangiaceae bacterium]